MTFASCRTLDIARTIRDDGIDLLIERKGHTHGGRLGILAQRPAAVQIHYMSFPGTIGYDAVDGVIADAEVVPPGAEADFHERVWRLPRCYYVNDNRRGVPRPSPRRDNGLPDDALVLACLNQSYKLRRPFFSVVDGGVARAIRRACYGCSRATRGRRPICAPRPREAASIRHG